METKEDFTVEDLKILKEEVTNELNDLLVEAKQLFADGVTDIKMYDNLCLYKTSGVATIIDKKSDQVKELLEQILSSENDDVFEDVPVVKIGYDVEMTGHTFASGRYDIFDYVKFYPVWYRVIDEIEEEVIKRETKKRLNRLVQPLDFDDSGYKVFELDCKLLEQFKAGKLTMSEVVQASMEDCSI